LATASLGKIYYFDYFCAAILSRCLFFVVLSCFCFFCSAEAVEAVAGSSAFALDLLLKYVYLALATPRPPVPPDTTEGAALEAALLEQKKWSGLLLKWHPVVVAKTGPGGVVRVMTERKTV
jgi:hypothetical protein